MEGLDDGLIVRELAEDADDGGEEEAGFLALVAQGVGEDGDGGFGPGGFLGFLVGFDAHDHPVPPQRQQMLLHTLQTLHIYLIRLIKQPILNIYFRLEPHQLQPLQLNQLLIPMRPLLPRYLLQRILHHHHRLRMILLQLKRIIKLLFLF